MRVDRTEFLRLTLLLAVACERPTEAPQAPSVALQIPPLDAGAPPAPQPAEKSSTDAEQVDPSCSNAAGSLEICARVGPTCEGLREECEQLRDDLRPRVAERWAACFAKTRAPRCRDKRLGACMREAIEAACIEPGTALSCKKIMAACEAAGTPPKYDLTTCAKILSAVVPGKTPGDWDTVDRERLGPSTEEGACSLEYVLPYQPYGWMWR